MTDKDLEEAQIVWASVEYSGRKKGAIEIARIRSEARAEALREAAERSERWCDDFDVPYGKDISNAILADEPNKEE